jgi:hypothetical protein
MVLYSIEDIILAGSPIQGYMLHIRMCKESCLKKTIRRKRKIYSDPVVLDKDVSGQLLLSRDLYLEEVAASESGAGYGEQR